MALYRLPQIHRKLDHHSGLTLTLSKKPEPNRYHVTNPSKVSYPCHTPSLVSTNTRHVNNSPLIISTPLAIAGPGQAPQRARFSTSAQSEKANAAVSWVDMYLPEKARGYARLARIEKPIGSWLLAWPFMWSLALATNPGSLPDVKMLALFSIWSVAIRGAACTINDYFDRNFDKQVERTKSRPIASGAVTPDEGLWFFFFQLLLGLGPLLYTNNFSRVLGVLHVPFVVAYPLMKRVTYWPQAFLGLMFNWGVILGWAVVKGSLDPAVLLPLYISSFFWTLVYDTIYAHQDKEDDVKAGVKSTALQFGENTKPIITVFGIACMTTLALSGYNANIGWPFYALLAVATGQLGWQIWDSDLSSPADCNRKFVSNKWYGAIVFSAILLGRLLV